MPSLNDRIARLLGEQPAASTARPHDGKRRVEIMISGPLNRVGVVRQSLDDLQRRLLSEASGNGDSLQLRVTASSTAAATRRPWSNRPIDAGAATNRWHCFQGQAMTSELLGPRSRENGAADRAGTVGTACIDIEKIAKPGNECVELTASGLDGHACGIGNTGMEEV